MISIVTAYYNRKDLFIKTLESIENSTIKDYEIIVVDDNSSEEHRLEDLTEKYPKLKIIRINPEEKKWINPCMNFNIGFKEAKGDIVILQNPECKHNGDILNYASKIVKGQYFSFACYSLDRESTYSEKDFQIVDRSVTSDGDLAWYNHSKYRPKAYHFCSVITKDDLNVLGGFDERYGDGIAYDDDEFLYRVRKIGLQVSIVDYPFVVHQWHQSVNYSHLGGQTLVEKNRNLYHNFTLQNK
jgi:glycosyltransferase involved in cell wall biosynthesis